jgi:hypothetical protein
MTKVTDRWTPARVTLFPVILSLAMACKSEPSAQAAPDALPAASSVANTTASPVLGLEQFCQTACERAFTCGEYQLAASERARLEGGRTAAVSTCRRECASQTPETYGEKKAYGAASSCLNAPTCETFDACWSAVIERRREAMR